MTSQVKGLVLLYLLKISVVHSKVPSSIKPLNMRLSASDTTKTNPHTEINRLAVTAKTLSQPGTELYVATTAVQAQ